MTDCRTVPSERAMARALVLAIWLATATAAPAQAAEIARLKATYAITLAIFTIGKVDVETIVSDGGYDVDIKGSTTGLGRLVSNSQASLAGAGAVSGSRINPATYSLRTSEGDFKTRVDMTMRGGSVVGVDADPQLQAVPDRVPITAESLKRVLDPVGALMIARPSSTAPDDGGLCKRTVPVFDGWQRYDIALSYKETRTFNGRGQSYSGPVIVCQARYVPVAGHRLSREAVQYMADNQRLEAWLAPVKNTTLMVPAKIIIGTAVGDLAITARDFVVTTPPKQASTTQ
jgi:hypothetical protein